MMNKIELTVSVLQRSLDVVVLKTEEGIQALIAGGDKAHIGAVCVIDVNGNRVTHRFPTHRDDVVAQKWAEDIFKKTHTAVVVSAGIHYDNISPEQIKQILCETDRVLEDVLCRL